jgi:hypothetical protein
MEQCWRIDANVRGQRGVSRVSGILHRDSLMSVDMWIVFETAAVCGQCSINIVVLTLRRHKAPRAIARKKEVYQKRQTMKA